MQFVLLIGYRARVWREMRKSCRRKVSHWSSHVV